MSHEEDHEGRQRRRTVLERVDALEKERKRDDEWQEKIGERIGLHESRLDALDHYVHHCGEGGGNGNGLEKKIEQLILGFNTLASSVAKLHELASRDKITLHFTLNEQENAMQTLDPQHGFTDRKLPFEAFVGMAGPPDADGNPTVVPDPAKPLKATSSDPAQADAVQIDATHFEITTPLAEGGAATITIDGANNTFRVEPVQFAWDYVVPTVDRINVAFGGLVADEG